MPVLPPQTMVRRKATSWSEIDIRRPSCFSVLLLALTTAILKLCPSKSFIRSRTPIFERMSAASFFTDGDLPPTYETATSASSTGVSTHGRTFSHQVDKAAAVEGWKVFTARRTNPFPDAFITSTENRKGAEACAVILWYSGAAGHDQTLQDTLLAAAPKGSSKIDADKYWSSRYQKLERLMVERVSKEVVQELIDELAA